MPPTPPPVGPVTEPIPVLTQRPTWRDSFGVLGVYNYRLYVFGQLFANMGSWMARVAIGWLMLELTGDVTLVGITFALQFAPTLVFGPWAGVISDRASRRIVLMMTQGLNVLAYGALAAVVLLGVVQVWEVVLIAAITGTTMAVDAPSRSGFISEMVGTSRLRAAISLNSANFNLGGVIGPALSGVLIAVIGTGWSIAVNSGTAAIAVAALALMRRNELVPTPRLPRARGQIREAFVYAMRKPTIRWPLFLMLFVSTFGMNLPVLLTAAADHRAYDTGAAGYGFYNTLAALGALIGSLLASRRRTLRLRDAVGFAGLFSVVMMLGGWESWYPLFLSALVGLGIARLLFSISAESLIQLSTNPGIRGRVMSLYLMVMMGGQALGSVVLGWVAEVFGASVGFLVAGAGPLLAAIFAAIVLAHRHQLRLRVDLRSPRRLVRIVPRRA